MSFKSQHDARGIVNVPSSGVVERVLLEKDLGNGSVYRRAYLEEVLVAAGVALVAMTTSLPANHNVLFASLNFDTLVAMSTETDVDAVKVGFGTAADPDRYAISGVTLTKNTKTDNVPADSLSKSTSAQTPRISACATGGAAASVGTMTGSVRARILYEYTTSIGNAA